MDLSRLYVHVCSMYSWPLSNFSALYVCNPIGRQCMYPTKRALLAAVSCTRWGYLLLSTSSIGRLWKHSELVLFRISSVHVVFLGCACPWFATDSFWWTPFCNIFAFAREASKNLLPTDIYLMKPFAVMDLFTVWDDGVHGLLWYCRYSTILLVSTFQQHWIISLAKVPEIFLPWHLLYAYS